MAKVKVLIEGYAKETDSGWLASSTTVLIEDSNKRIIVDPGINKDLLLKKLKAEGLSPNVGEQAAKSPFTSNCLGLNR